MPGENVSVATHGQPSSFRNAFHRQRLPAQQIGAIRERLLALASLGPSRDPDSLQQALDLLEPLCAAPHSDRVRMRASLLSERLAEWFAPHLLPQDIHVARQRRRMDILILRLSASLADLD